MQGADRGPKHLFYKHCWRTKEKTCEGCDFFTNFYTSLLFSFSLYNENIDRDDFEASFQSMSGILEREKEISSA